MPRLHNDEQNQHFLLFPQSLKEQKSIKLWTVCMDKTDVEANVTETNVTETNVTEANVTETNMTEANVTEANVTEANMTDQSV